jgi:hypothetical protein
MLTNIIMLVHNATTTNKGKGILLKASREAGLEVNAEETKYVVVSRHQNGQEHYFLIENKFF